MLIRSENLSLLIMVFIFIVEFINDFFNINACFFWSENLDFIDIV